MTGSEASDEVVDAFSNIFKSKLSLRAAFLNDVLHQSLLDGSLKENTMKICALEVEDVVSEPEKA